MKNIYLVTSDLTPTVVYVGQTKHHPEVRLLYHIHTQPTDSIAKYKWVSFIKKMGGKLKVILLETCQDECGNKRERWWIESYRGKKEFVLLNMNNINRSEYYNFDFQKCLVR